MLACRALYGILLSPELARSNKSTIFLSLLFRAMRADVSDRRVAAFVKRTLQVAMEQLPNFACGCLLLLSELLKVPKSSKSNTLSSWTFFGRSRFNPLHITPLAPNVMTCQGI